MDSKCVACGSVELKIREDYLQCQRCYHEVLIDRLGQTYIINDNIDPSSMDKFTALDRFKNRILDDCLPPAADFMVDFGSATGRFLYQNRNKVPHVAGIEVTPEVLEYSRESLGLTVYENMDDLERQIDLMTSWHSMEHVPVEQTRDIIKKIHNAIRPGGVLLVSVPNSLSFQYRLFGARYAYYDVPNHHHQFSLTSLNTLLGEQGFKQEKLYFSFIYNLFGWTQGFLNYTTKVHNYLYYRKKRNNLPKKRAVEVLQYIFLPVAVPLAFICTCLEWAFPERQGVITVKYMRKSDKK